MATMVFLLMATLCAYVHADGIGNEVYVLNFDSPIYVCPDEDSQTYVDTSQVEVKRHNETTSYLIGSIQYLKGIEDGTMLELLVERDVGGSYEMFTSHEICDFCKEIQDEDSAYNGYLKHFGFPKECPISPDTFELQEFVADANVLPINSGTAGRYQVTMNVYTNPEKNCLNEKTFTACLKFDFIVEPL